MSRIGWSMMVVAGQLAAMAAHGQQQAAEAGPKPIPRAQFIASIDGEFRKTDADRNGQLTRTEIEQFQKLQAIAGAETRNRRLFAELDADRNGQLSPAEFTKLPAPPPLANAQPLLARMDGNRDSQISLVEYRAATVANFDRLDRDRDGVVTPTEMKAGGISPR